MKWEVKQIYAHLVEVLGADEVAAKMDHLTATTTNAAMVQKMKKKRREGLWVPGVHERTDDGDPRGAHHVLDGKFSAHSMSSTHTHMRVCCCGGNESWLFFL